MKASIIILLSILIMGCITSETPSESVSNEIKESHGEINVEVGAEFIQTLELDKLLTPDKTKEIYTVSFVTVRPTNAPGYDFQVDNLSNIVSKLDEFFNEMSHGKTSIVLGEYYGEINYPGNVTCVKVSYCPESFLDTNILKDLIKPLNIKSDFVVVLADVLEPKGNAYGLQGWSNEDVISEYSYENEVMRRKYSVHDTEQLSLLTLTNVFFDSDDEYKQAKILAHEMMHTQTFLQTQDTYIGGFNLVGSRLIADLMSTTDSYLSVNKRAALGWDEYHELDAQNKFVEFEIKPNCLTDQAYNIPLGTEYLNLPGEGDSYAGILEHKIYFEWGGNNACSLDERADEGIYIIETFERFNYDTKRMWALKQLDGVLNLTTGKIDFHRTKFTDNDVFAMYEDLDIEIIQKNESSIKLRVRVNREKEETKKPVVDIYKYKDTDGVLILTRSLDMVRIIAESNTNTKWLMEAFPNTNGVTQTKQLSFFPNEESERRLPFEEKPFIDKSKNLQVEGVGLTIVNLEGFSCDNSLDMNVLVVDSLGDYGEFQYPELIPC